MEFCFKFRQGVKEATTDQTKGVNDMSIWRKKIALFTLLKLQLLYCLLGMSYNIVSYYLMISGSPPLSSNSPITGGVGMLAFGLCLISAQKGFYKTYRWLMALFLIVFGYGGIVKHFIVFAQQPEAYASYSAWLVAIGSNSFGFLLNLAAATGRFEIRETA